MTIYDIIKSSGNEMFYLDTDKIAHDRFTRWEDVVDYLKANYRAGDTINFFNLKPIEIAASQSLLSKLLNDNKPKKSV